MGGERAPLDQAITQASTRGARPDFRGVVNETWGKGAANLTGGRTERPSARKEATFEKNSEGALESKSEPIREARHDLEAELKRLGHGNPTMQNILNKFESGIVEARQLSKNMGKYPTAKTMAERLDLLHYDPDAIPDDEKIASAYRTAAEALRSKAVGPFADQKNVSKFVIEGLRNISDITGIDQGSYTTCGPTSGEKYIAARRPDEYMNMLRQLIQTGQYRTPHGNAFSYVENKWLDKEDATRTLKPNLQPGAEEQRWSYLKDGKQPQPGQFIQDGTRNWASQAIQSLCMENAKICYDTKQIPDAVTTWLAGKLLPCSTFRHVEDFTARVTGTPMSAINQRKDLPSAANIARPMTDNLAKQLQWSGRYPVLDWVGPHWFTDNAAKLMPDGSVRILQDNQWGRAADGGWTSVQQRASSAADSLRRQGYTVL